MKPIAAIVQEQFTALAGGPPSEPDPVLGGALDSLDVVELLVRLEDAIEDEYGRSPHLLGNEDVMAYPGPLETVGSLVRYLEEAVDG